VIIRNLWARPGVIAKSNDKSSKKVLGRRDERAECSPAIFTIMGVLLRSCNPKLRIEIEGGWVLGGRFIEDSEYVTLVSE
jgi:hypothetical protein